MRSGRALQGVPVAGAAERRVLMSEKCPLSGMSASEATRRRIVSKHVTGALELSGDFTAVYLPSKGINFDDSIDKIGHAFGDFIGRNAQSWLLGGGETRGMPERVATLAQAYYHGSDAYPENQGNKVTRLMERINRGSGRSVPKLVDFLLEQAYVTVDEAVYETVCQLGALVVVAGQLEEKDPIETLQRSTLLVNELAKVNKTTDTAIHKILGSDQGVKRGHDFKGFRYDPDNFFISERGSLMTADLAGHFESPEYQAPTPGCPALVGGGTARYVRALTHSFYQLGVGDQALAA